MSVFRKKFPALLLCAAFLAGCGEAGPPPVDEVYADILAQPGGRKTAAEPLVPDLEGQDGIKVAESSVLDLSHASDGYFAYTYTGNAGKAVLQVTQPDGRRYPYPVIPGKQAVLNFVSGDGEYKLDVLEHKGGNAYTTVLSEIIDVTLSDEFLPFLYPNQYMDYGRDSACVALAAELSAHSATDLTFVENTYNYVVSAISYDKELAENISTNYIPDPDATLASGKGICFDYASLMASMLRSQGVPTKLEVGYAGTAYHAWISVYLKETGWVDNIIEFDGESWSFMDPTVAANGTGGKEMKKLIGDGTSYTVQYHY